MIFFRGNRKQNLKGEANLWKTTETEKPPDNNAPNVCEWGSGFSVTMAPTGVDLLFSSSRLLYDRPENAVNRVHLKSPMTTTIDTVINRCAELLVTFSLKRRHLTTWLRDDRFLTTGGRVNQFQTNHSSGCRWLHGHVQRLMTLLCNRQKSLPAPGIINADKSQVGVSFLWLTFYGRSKGKRGGEGKGDMGEWQKDGEIWLHGNVRVRCIRKYLR